MLIGVDIGTTHCKAGLCADDGSPLQIALRPMTAHTSPAGWQYYDPAEVLAAVYETISEVCSHNSQPIAAIGIASMAETGLLVERKTGAPRTPLIPWFEQAPLGQAAEIAHAIPALACYQRFGLKINAKSSLSKILWLQRGQQVSLEGAVWLSTADYVAAALTGGEYGTDYSLACRTLAFNLAERQWDRDWLAEWGLPAALFPPARQAGSPVGLTNGALLQAGIPAGIPVAVCGHDHICAAFGAGAVSAGSVFDSIGTAETLVGALPERPLTAADFERGLLYGLHVAPGLAYWLGGCSAAGGSVEWLRSLHPGETIDYAKIAELVDSIPAKPTGIFYFPYLRGASSPHTDPRLRGALIGLDARHSFAHLCRAVLEGTAYEMEFIRRAGEAMLGQKITSIRAAGGGTRLPAWLQLRADLSGCVIQTHPHPESALQGAALAALQGAALAAGLGSGRFSSPAEARDGERVYSPDPSNQAEYTRLFETGYLPLMQALQRWTDSTTG